MEIAGRRSEVRPCVGVHPHRAAGFEMAQAAEFESMAADPRVIGIGEIGLDYYYDFSPRDKQMETLSFFLDLAGRARKPACLHVRDKSGESAATADVRAQIQSRAGRIRGVIHCFTGAYDDARGFLDLGFYLSFTGIITFRTAGPLRDVLARIPPDRVLLETDSPYLAPEPHRGRRNEPAFLARVFDVTAQAFGLSAGSWSEQIQRNQRDLFGIDIYPAGA